MVLTMDIIVNNVEIDLKYLLIVINSFLYRLCISYNKKTRIYS